MQIECFLCCTFLSLFLDIYAPPNESRGGGGGINDINGGVENRDGTCVCNLLHNPQKMAD